MAKNKGFTLLELLIVVLIIGILAAVALPEYRVATAKTKMQKMIIYGKAVKNSAELYYQVNGQYPPSWDELDVEIPLNGVCPTADPACHKSGSGFSVDMYYGSHKNLVFKQIPVSIPFYYVVWFDNAGNAALNGKRQCLADPDDAAANRLCRSLGGAENGTAQTGTTGVSGIYKNYDLP